MPVCPPETHTGFKSIGETRLGFCPLLLLCSEALWFFLIPVLALAYGSEDIKAALEPVVDWTSFPGGVVGCRGHRVISSRPSIPTVDGGFSQAGTDTHASTAIQAVATTSSSPGATRAAKLLPPAVKLRTTLVAVFVVSPTKIGIAASLTLSFPDATNETTETAAECASANPAIAAAARTPALPR